MIIKTNKNYMTRMFQIANAIIPGRTAVIPAMNFIKMVAAADGITFTTTNGTTTAVTKMLPDEYDLGGSGTACMDVPIGVAALQKSKAENVVISVEEGSNACRMKLDKALYNLNGCDPRNFPDVKIDTENKTHFVWKKAEIDAINNCVGYACATNETRPVLTGVNVRSDGNKVIATATDSYRLAKLEFEAAGLPEFNVTFPKRTLVLVCSIFDADADIDVYVSEKAVVFTDGITTIQTTMYEQSYPDTEKLIPVEFEKTLKIKKADLLNSLEMAMLLKEEGQTVIRLKMAEDDVCLASKSSERGDFTDALEFISYEGEPFEITMSAAYLRDALKATKGEDIMIRFKSKLQPFVVTGETTGQLGLLLPVRTYD